MNIAETLAACCGSRLGTGRSDVCSWNSVTEKWGRPQHHVNYKVFRRNRLSIKPGCEANGCDDFGMELQRYEPSDDGDSLEDLDN